jgi:choline dehydrogenase-like flavoprotein
MLEFEAPLNEDGAATLTDDSCPLVNVNRKPLDDSDDFKNELISVVKAIREAFKFPGKDEPKLADWGSVAHEVGTMRMDRPDGKKDRKKDGKERVVKGVVDENLKVHSVDNLFVCDLSVFPYSPMENPSRTLTALAMRLADHLKTR